MDALVQYWNDANYSALLSKVLSYGIIGGALLYKIPQVQKIIKNGSIKGLAFSLFALELTSAAISLPYNFRNDVPLTNFMEMFFVAGANVVISLMFCRFDPAQSLTVLSTLAFLVGSCFLIFQEGIVDKTLLDYLFASTTMIMCASRVPQIWSNMSGGTENISLITWVLNAAGSTARVFTTFKELGDGADADTKRNLMVSYGIGAVLNCTVTLQIVYYQFLVNGSKAKLGSGKKKSNSGTKKRD